MACDHSIIRIICIMVTISDRCIPSGRDKTFVDRFGSRGVNVINYELQSVPMRIIIWRRQIWNALRNYGLLAVQFHYLCLTRGKKTREEGREGREARFVATRATRFLRDWYASKRQEFNKLSTSHCSPYYMKLITQLLTNISYSLTKRS